MRIVICGLSITSAWGNGHATTYRSLVSGLLQRGHEVAFLERDMPWYAAHRDLAALPGCRIELYADLAGLERRFRRTVEQADAVILGSYVPDGIAVGRWLRRRAGGVFAFYDIDTPVTLAKLARGEHDYIDPELLRAVDLYLSFTGGPTLDFLEEEYGAACARALYCSVDSRLYRPLAATRRWRMGYLGTYSDDRQPKLDTLMLQVAAALPGERFVVAGPLYPESIAWPANVERLEHVGPPDHRAFYAAQDFALNITRADMVAMGWSPSVRLFEAAACGIPIISDVWPGLDELFRPGLDILVAESQAEVAEVLTTLPESRRRAVGQSARQRVLAAHSSSARAAELEGYLAAVATRSTSRPGIRAGSIPAAPAA